MADNISITPGSGALIRTNQGTSSGAHMQIIKIAESAAGSENFVPATVANGLTCDVTRIQTAVTVNNLTPSNLKVDASGANVPVINATGTSLNVAAANTAPVAVRVSNGSAWVDTIPVNVTNASVTVGGSVSITGTPAVSQSGTWNINALTSITNTVTVSGSVSITGTPSVSGTVTSNQGTPATVANAWPTKISDGTNTAGLTLVGSNYGLKVDVIKQTGGGYSQQDKTAFTEGTTFFEPVGGQYNDALVSDPAAGQGSAVRITAKRAFHVNPRNSSGVELATATNPYRIDPTGTTTQPVSGTVTANQGGAPWSSNLTQIGGNAIATVAAGIQKVGISDIAGNAFTRSNPFPVIESEASFTRVSNAVTFSANQTDIAIWTPAGGKKFVVLGVIVTVTASGVLKIYDNTNAAANMLYQGSPGAGTFVIQFTKPWLSSAVNNVLRYSTGAAAGGDIVTYGYEA